jgi:polysaccharide biosynthesis/export protein
LYLARKMGWLVLAMALNACVQHGGKSHEFAPDLITSSTDRASPRKPALSRKYQQVALANGFKTQTTRQNDYRISGLDVLEVSVLGVPDLSRVVQVSSEGFISLPLIRTLQAGGMTAHELENQIAAKLAVAYMQAPQVSVFIKEFNSQRITVDGAVVKPGVYPFTGNFSLLQAIATSQGLSAVADPSAILVFRNVDGKNAVARFDIRQIRSGQAPNPLLEAGDIVTIDESQSRATLRAIKEALPLTGLFQLFSL